MKVLVEIVGVLALVGGAFLLFRAVTYPGGFALSTASAVQITQVYSEATYYGVLSVAAFVLAGVLLLAAGSRGSDG